MPNKIVHIWQPNGYSCGLACLAMVGRTTIEDVIATIGHDGSEIIFPDEHYPSNRRGLSDSDNTYFFYKKGIKAYTFDFEPTLTSNGVNEYREPSKVWYLLPKHNGIIQCEMSNCRHVVVWDAAESLILDPQRGRIRMDDFRYPLISFTAIIEP